MRLFLVRLKIIFRQKEDIFWTLFFPIILGVFLYLGFGGLKNSLEMAKVDLFIASTENENFNSYFIDLAKKTVDKNNNLVFEVKVQEYNDLKDALKSYQIDSYIYLDESEKVVLTVLNDDIRTSLIRDLVVNYYYLLDDVAFLETQNVVINHQDLISKYVFLSNEVVIRSKNIQSANMGYFYALIAMACLAACYRGTRIIEDIKADVSPLATRMNLAAKKRLSLIVSYLMAAEVVQFLGNLLLVLFLKYFLGVYFANLFLTFLILFAGSFLGISIGILIGTFVKGSDLKRHTIGTAIYLISSFLTGLMSVKVKNGVDSFFPLIKYLNPGSIIHNALNALNFNNSFGEFGISIALLLGFSFLIIVVANQKIKGEKYDSL